MIAQLKSGKADQIEKAQVQIKADLPSRKQFWLWFMRQDQNIENWMTLSDLEKRRRRILEDYEISKMRAIDLRLLNSLAKF